MVRPADESEGGGEGRCLSHPQGDSTFLPRLLVTRWHGPRRWQSLEALFPGYVFARFALDPHTLHAVRWTPGVKRVLGDETTPIPVPDDVVDFLQQRVGKRGFLLPGPQFAAGTRVRFVHGSFACLEGIVERPPSRTARVRVLLTLLNTQVSVDVAADELEPV